MSQAMRIKVKCTFNVSASVASCHAQAITVMEGRGVEQLVGQGTSLTNCLLPLYTISGEPLLFNMSIRQSHPPNTSMTEMI